MKAEESRAKDLKVITAEVPRPVWMILKLYAIRHDTSVRALVIPAIIKLAEKLERSEGAQEQ